MFETFTWPLSRGSSVWAKQLRNAYFGFVAFRSAKERGRPAQERLKSSRSERRQSRQPRSPHTCPAFAPLPRLLGPSPELRNCIIFRHFSAATTGRMLASVRSHRACLGLLMSRPTAWFAPLSPLIRQGPTVPSTTVMLAGAIRRAVSGRHSQRRTVGPVEPDSMGFFGLSLPSCLL